MNEKKDISLVLSSGGARGYAHIGVIEVLEEHGFNIRSISGTSMGAVIGALYAGGVLAEYKEWVIKLAPIDVAALLDISWAKGGIISGDRVMKKVAGFLGEKRIEDLSIPFTAVATDLNRNREIWFQKGDIITALRASVAIPSFFTPVKYNNMLLVDGGVLNPLPVAPTMADQTDLIVASNVHADIPNPLSKDRKKKKNHKEKETEEGAEESSFQKIRKAVGNAIPSLSFSKRVEHEIMDNISAEINETIHSENGEEQSKERKSKHKDKDINIFKILDKTYDTMQATLIRYRLGAYPPNIMIDVSKHCGGIMDFHRAEDIIEAGRISAEIAIKKYFREEEDDTKQNIL